MNRSRYIPFERNRYFYGKLLTVRDFMTEQTYNADKRRLVNRLLFGSGVVAGLQVVAVDDKSVSVSTGVALDQLGREIVVPSPLTLKLSNVEGFSNNEYAKNVYLCIAYDEKGKEPVHSVAGASGRDEEVSEYNRILESYRIFVREQPPAPGYLEYDNLIYDTFIWYDDGQIRVLQTVPRYLEPGQQFEMRLTVEKTLQTPHIEFEYVPEWSGVEAAEELANGKIRFSEPTDGEQTSYTRIFRMRALPLPEGETRGLAQLAAAAESARMVVGERVIHDLSHLQQTIEISEEPAADRILNAYFSRPLDRAMESPNEPCVYLARINLLQMGATYVINSVEPLPFHDMVINPTMFYKLMAALDKVTVPSGTGASAVQAAPVQQPAEETFPDIKEDFASIMEEEEDPLKNERVSTGIVEISIVPPPKKKWYHRRQRNFFSEEIEHGLGAGPVLLSAGLSDELEQSEVVLPEMWNRRDTVHYGPQEVFGKTEFESDLPKLTIGFIHYPKKGTFRIGVRVNRKTDRTRVRLRWWAVRAGLDLSASGNQEAEDDLEQGLQEAAPAKN
jgi:hypothetical protein